MTGETAPGLDISCLLKLGRWETINVAGLKVIFQGKIC